MIRVQHLAPLCLFVSCVAFCTCASLGTTSGKGNKFPSGFGLTPAQFQSWQEWAKKSSFGGAGGSPAWGQGLSSRDDFQGWREFMNKRGFHIPDSSLSHQQFQSWVDWSKRQGLGSNEETPFPNSQSFGKFGNYQNWSDWYAKRGIGSSPFGQQTGGFANVGNHGASGMQSWDEFMKRQGFGHGKQGFGHPNVGSFQSWTEWAKRMGPSGSRWGDFGTGGFDLGNKQQFTDWQNMYQHSADKRQLGGFSPNSFGSFHQYFTDGLQDWRSTFKGNKRNVESGSGDGNSATGSSDKEQAQ
ncbi:hypothetical protein PoB_006733500 [Plakobranchus ocellatus]|uniref:Uncharacterized protein n=1 Tax=Plakobranchus ocellatus TaxID=259542 RepID=A0AAV4DA43_9GAST|nr:hypothetical protein PoB_006733500 [Plakobranchus ocellatus]